MRYQLSTLEHPASVQGWYACFSSEAVGERQRCLVEIPGVRLDEGHGQTCPDPPDPALLCRAFPLGPPEPSPDASTEEGAGDAAAEAVVEGFFRVLFAVFEAALSSDDDDDDGHEDSAREQSERRERARSYRRAEPVRRRK